MNKNIKIILMSLLIILLILLTFRLISQRELDDFHPDIPCSKELIKKSNILWIIPKYNNISIDTNQEWCTSIKNLNKTLGLHGVYHSYREFQTDKDQTYLEEGTSIFKNCFGYAPTMFKPPALAISKKNRQLIEKNNLDLKARFNQITHKVYHCSDTGDFSNKFIDWF